MHDRAGAASRTARTGAAAVILAGVIVLTGCTDTDPVVTDAPTETESETPEPSEPEATESGWVDLDLGDGNYSVSVPADWSVDDVVPSDPVQLDTYFLNADGQQLLHFNIVVSDGGIGGACQEEDPVFEVIASEPSDLAVPPEADAANESTVLATISIEQTEGGYGLGVGLTAQTHLEHPYCLGYLLMRPIGGAAWGQFGTTYQIDPLMTDRPDQVDSPFLFASREELDAYLEGEEYQQILQVLESVTYNGS